MIKNEEGLPFKTFIHCINGIEMHFHNEMEIILVLQGSVNIRVGNDVYFLNENELILINSNEIHKTSSTGDDNILLALQIDPKYFSTYGLGFNKIVFDCRSFLYGEEDQEDYNMIRHYLAKIVWELNKKRKGYKLIVGSDINLLAVHLVNNFNYYIMEDETVASRNSDIIRLQSIISYINENIEKKISLQEVADRQKLSVYYLSHFIKKKMGISFQEYLNNIRLDKAVYLLAKTNKTITDISYESGFPSVKALNKKFKELFGYSPMVYRKRSIANINDSERIEEKDSDKKRSRTYLDVDRNAALKKLFSYLKLVDNKLDNDFASSTREIVSVNTKSEGDYYDAYWKKLITYTRAAEGMRAGWQNQLKELQSEIGFEYIRFHGIFSDDMMICNYDEEGKIVYNWSYVDELFDFFKSIGIRPFVELSFMPTELKETSETSYFWWRPNISKPKNIKLWRDLVVEFIKHSINRYGLIEVEAWYFEVWNEPDLKNVFWAGEKEEYFEFYKETALAIKSLSNKIRVGGPSITYQAFSSNTWLDDFLEYCNENNAPIDFVSLHIYPEAYASEEEVGDLLAMVMQGEGMEDYTRKWKGLKRIYFDKNHTSDILTSANKKINNCLEYCSEIYITEWNASAYSRNLIHDTCYVAAFIIRNILMCIGKAASLGYWTFTDINEETKAGISAFHGGFGLINKNGLKKPSYFAYHLLSKLGTKIIKQGEEWIVTRKDDDIQFLAYNYAYFDDLFLSGDTSSLTRTERYGVFEAKGSNEIGLSIKELSGNYKITKYELNRENGSVVDEWINMGSPEDMTQEELSYLKGKAYPKMSVEYLMLDGEYKENLNIPVHGVMLITLEKKL